MENERSSKETAGQRYQKADLLRARRYQNKVDLVNALLHDAAAYTLEEVDAVIEKFQKGKVKEC